MQAITPSIKLHSYQQNQGIYINTFILEHEGYNYHFQAATTDTIHIFTAGICIYLLRINTKLHYMGLNTYMKPEADPINSILIETADELQQLLGNNWKQLLPETIAIKLTRYLI
jgi:hypothetical protein